MNYIFCNKSRIHERYNKTDSGNILGLIEQLRKANDGKICFIDELPEEYEHFSQNPVNDAEAFRELINFIDRDTTKVHSFLLIGGDDSIPFCEIENPTNDDDEKILCDAPYACRDDDFLIPQRSIGRIPDSHGEQSDFLPQVLERAVEYHKGVGVSEQSFGYSASIWRKASRAVFRTIGDEDEMRLSPPLGAADLEQPWLEKQFLYFNLHGSKGTPHWYGQRAHDDPPEFEMFPIAIRPENVPAMDRSCVFTEACYGGWVHEKAQSESIALTCLSRGSIAFVGSTAIAYGPIEPPSGEADLLARYFFEYALRGIPFGDALRHGKIDFARTMIRRQGFLDSDDKKTLLEFQLYGDPSLTLLAGK